MKYDGKLDISVGKTVKSKIWKNKKILWSDLVKQLSSAINTHETFREYLQASKPDQLGIKDVGGYVGGFLRNGRRKPENVLHRQLLTLDIDFAHLNFWDDFTLFFDCAAVLHATHRHHSDSPRYRLVIPLSEEVTPEKYVAIARKIAGILNIDLFDKTTFETNRLMFWPSVSKDVEYYYEVQDGPFLDVEKILNYYEDWRDSSKWPTSEKEYETVNSVIKKQEDPENKRGVIGAFCRTYSITEAIETFLSDVYTPTDLEDRFTYSKGTTAAGLILYDDKFAFSHHGTDPCSGKLCNSFDLVRIHLFGHLDEEGVNRKSLKEMEAFILKDKQVKKTLSTERSQNAKYEFTDEDEPIEPYEENLEWMEELEIDSKGGYLSTANNINLLLRNDIRLKDLFRHNNFDGRKYVFGNLPWRKVPAPEPVKNVDYSGVRNYIESIYGISGALKIEDALSLEFERNAYHPVLDYLKNLKWDKVERLDSLLIDYFGAEENLYSKEAIRKTLVGAVARIFVPGIKFDYVLTLVGEQGSGKSTFVKTLGKSWFSDTFLTVHGKEALEQIQGAWLIEMAELSGLRKAEVEAVKHFISKQEDTFRPAYARSSETYLRQCVFFGTTNNKDFLRDPSGNRRFLPVDVDRSKITKDVFNIPEEEINQIWAEAVYLFKQKEKLYLSKEAEALAKVEQEKHSELDERKGLILEYLETEYPDNWDELDVLQRQMFLDDPLSSKGKYRKDFVCVAELWCECLGKKRQEIDRWKTREINDIMRSVEGWDYISSTRNFPIYGKQKYYVRKNRG